MLKTDEAAYQSVLLSPLLHLQACFFAHPLPLIHTATQYRTRAMAPRHPPSSSSPTPSMAPSRHCCSAPVLLQPTLREEAHAAGLEITPLANQPLGAEVVGLDLIHKPITPALVSAVRKALLTHQVSLPLCVPLCPGVFYGVPVHDQGTKQATIPPPSAS